MHSTRTWPECTWCGRSLGLRLWWEHAHSASVKGKNGLHVNHLLCVIEWSVFLLVALLTRNINSQMTNGVWILATMEIWKVHVCTSLIYMCMVHSRFMHQDSVVLQHLDLCRLFFLNKILMYKLSIWLVHTLPPGICNICITLHLWWFILFYFLFSEL